MLVGITRRTGALKFTFTKGKDVFDTHEEAMQYLKGMGPRLEVSRGLGVGTKVHTHEEAMQYVKGMEPRLEVSRGPGGWDRGSHA